MTRSNPTKRWKTIDSWSANKCENLSAIEKSVDDRQANNQRQRGRRKLKTGNKQGNLTNKERKQKQSQLEKSLVGYSLSFSLNGEKNPFNYSNCIGSNYNEGNSLSIFRLQCIPIHLMAPILIASKHPGRIAGAGAGKNDGAYLDIVNVNTAIIYLSRQDQKSRERDKERTRDWRKSDMLSIDSIFAIDTLACKIIKEVHGHHDRNPRNWVFEPELLFNKKTGGEVHQALHLDFPGADQQKNKHLLPIIVHIPMCQEGMTLQVGGVVGGVVDGDNPPTFRFYSFGEAAVLRADVRHGGCYGGEGNVRFRLVLTHESYIPLPRPNLDCVTENRPNTDLCTSPGKILEYSRLKAVREGRTMQKDFYLNKFLKAMEGMEFVSEGLTGNIDPNLIRMARRNQIKTAENGLDTSLDC